MKKNRTLVLCLIALFSGGMTFQSFGMESQEETKRAQKEAAERFGTNPSQNPSQTKPSPHPTRSELTPKSMIGENEIPQTRPTGPGVSIKNMTGDDLFIEYIDSSPSFKPVEKHFDIKNGNAVYIGRANTISNLVYGSAKTGNNAWRINLGTIPSERGTLEISITKALMEPPYTPITHDPFITVFNTDSQQPVTFTYEDKEGYTRVIQVPPNSRQIIGRINQIKNIQWKRSSPSAVYAIKKEYEYSPIDFKGKLPTDKDLLIEMATRSGLWYQKNITEELSPKRSGTQFTVDWPTLPIVSSQASSLAQRETPPLIPARPRELPQGAQSSTQPASSTQFEMPTLKRVSSKEEAKERPLPAGAQPTILTVVKRASTEKSPSPREKEPNP